MREREEKARLREEETRLSEEKARLHEQEWLQNGRRDAALNTLLMMLEVKFGAAAQGLQERLKQVGDAERLFALQKATMLATTLDEVQALLPASE